MNKKQRFSSFVVKVASRCNLNCDYCYMYQHVDQSWKNKPRTLSKEHQDLFVMRLEEYVTLKGLDHILIVYHGGEPLLFGADNIVNLSERIRNRLSSHNCRVDFGIQTNGVLLKKEHLEKFEKHDISVSLSIDGPKEIHDQHRVDLKGRPTFDKVFKGLELLKNYPHLFTGCIAVINPYSDPRKLFTFFDDNGVEELSILIPDANYITPPLGRDSDPDLYKKWLINAFDCWFDEFPHMKCKYFDWLLKGILGQPMVTDSFGLGDVSMLVLETDGTYHDHDVLKITKENSSSLGLSLENNPISAAEKAEKIQFHRKLLTKEGLSAKCKSCKHVDICGGGFVAHRYSNDGYANPSVYCDELYSLFDHMIARVDEQVQIESKAEGVQLVKEFDQTQMELFFDSKTSEDSTLSLLSHRARKNYARLQSVIPFALDAFPQNYDGIIACQQSSFETLKPALLLPATHCWLRALYFKSKNTSIYNADEEEILVDGDYFSELLECSSKAPPNDFVIQAPGKWYIQPFGTNIVTRHSKEELEKGLTVLQEALQIIKEYQVDLYSEMTLVSRYIQCLKDLNADPNKNVSFSDETLPGAIFIGLWKLSGTLSPYMLAASLIHEHLHQKLYLLQNRFELFPPQETLIFSPWPKKWRAPSAVIHAVYVFTHVAHFWKAMLDFGQESDLGSLELEMLLKRLDPCIKEINENVHFTDTGQLFFNCLWKKYQALHDTSALSLV